MALGTFRKALALAREYDDYLVIGGGEPTIHPQFNEFLLLALAEEHIPTIVTNGKNTDAAMVIAALTKKEVVDGELSQDEWHERIDPKVVKTFKELGNIRDISKGGTREPMPVGRAYKLVGRRVKKEDECACTDWFVKPSGVIRQCGCPRSPIIGHVDAGVEVHNRGYCYRDEEIAA